MKPSLVILFAFPALAGCNLAPHYRRPTVDDGERFKEAAAAQHPDTQGWKPAQPQDQDPRGEWWTVYDDAALSALEAKVATGNQSVRAAEAADREARALVVEARASLLPTLNLNPAVTASRSSLGAGGSNGTTGGGAGGGAPGSQRTVYSLPFQASYELDLWGRVRNQVRQNADLAQASAADWASALLSMQAELAQDYFSLRASDEQRKILETTLADYQASLHLVTTLFNSGLVSDEDLAQANTQLKSAQAQATDLGIARAQYEHAIAVLIGLAPSRFSLPVRRFSPKIPSLPLVLPGELLERRPDVAAAERQVAAANAGIGIARAAWFPALSIGASAGFESTALGSLLNWPNRFWSLGPTLAQTLFDGGARLGASEHAQAAYDQTVAQYRQTALAAFQAVEDNLVSLRLLAEEAAQQHSAVQSAEHTVQLSVTRYQQGLDSYVNVITAQNAFLTAREQELQIELRQVTASLQLVRNLGGGWNFADWGGVERAVRDSRSKEAARPDAPPETAAATPNPPPLPPPERKPEDLLRQDQEDMGKPNR